MLELSRRAFLGEAGALGGAAAAWRLLGNVAGRQRCAQLALTRTPAVVPPGLDPKYALMYASVDGERFPIPAIDLTKIDPAFLRSEVAYPTPEPPGTIVVDPAAHYLYFVEPAGWRRATASASARRASSGPGVATINSKQEWPDWYPPPR